MSDNDTRYDVVVVGGGAAGLGAALVLARARRRVAVVDSGEPRNAPAAHVHGFLSRDGMPPRSLLQVGRTEVAGYGGVIIDGRVERIHPGFVVRLAGGSALAARRVLVATGLRDELPAIQGVRDRFGIDVLHCPYCHGFEVRDRPIGVLGTDPHAVFVALLVRQWSDDVVYFAHATEPTDDERERLAARGIHIVEGAVGKIVVANDRLRGVELADGRVVPRDAVFVPPRMVPNDALLTGLGCARRDDGWVITDPTGQTSVPGVWVAGNVADLRAQVITAVAMGSAAAAAINHDLVDEDVELAVMANRAARVRA